jgi:hypothetical protein
VRHALKILVIVVALMSGVLSLVRELVGIYAPGKVPQASLFWRCTWIAFILSAAIVWYTEHKKVRELEQKLSLPAIFSQIAVGANRDKTTTPESLQISLILLNSWSGPIIYNVEKIEVLMDGHSVANPHFSNRGGLVPGGVATNFYYPSFDANLFKDKERIEGKIDFVLKYGNPDVGLTRTLMKGIDLFIRLDTMSSTFISRYETDETIK